MYSYVPDDGRHPQWVEISMHISCLLISFKLKHTEQIYSVYVFILMTTFKQLTMVMVFSLQGLQMKAPHAEVVTLLSIYHLNKTKCLMSSPRYGSSIQQCDWSMAFDIKYIYKGTKLWRCLNPEFE